MPKLILIYGPMAVGKSTTINALLLSLDGWVFLDRAYFKEMLSSLGRPEAKRIARKIMPILFDEVFESKKNILTQEVLPSWLQEKFKEKMETLGYEVFSFYLFCTKEVALKREIQRREQKGKEPRLQILEEVLEKHPEPTENDVTIDTEKYSTQEIVKVIKVKAGF